MSVREPSAAICPKCGEQWSEHDYYQNDTYCPPKRQKPEPTPDPPAANRQEEPCFDCGGSGVDGRDECQTCAGTGLLYTEQAIRDQLAVEEEHDAS